MNIFLTGEKQVGKSTLLNRLIAHYSLSVSGFQTKPYLINGHRKGFYLHSLVELDPSLQDVPISVQVGNHCLPQTMSFEQSGCQIIDHSLAHQNQIILLDELGTLEKDASAFQQRIFRCLDDERLVLGVIKKSSSPFLDQIRNDKNTIVIEITLENREAQFERLLELIMNNVY